MKAGGLYSALPRWHAHCSSTVQNEPGLEKGDLIMLWTILVILLVLWLLGVVGHVGGNLIHLLLVIAAVVLVVNLLTGRRAV